MPGRTIPDCKVWTHRPTNADEKTKIRGADGGGNNAGQGLRRGGRPAITRLFYETVRSVNRTDYSEEQVEAWAPAVPDAGEWHARMASRKSLVAEEGGEVAGFYELEEDGHLDMF